MYVCEHKHHFTETEFFKKYPIRFIFRRTVMFFRGQLKNCFTATYCFNQQKHNPNCCGCKFRHKEAIKSNKGFVCENKLKPARK